MNINISNTRECFFDDMLIDTNKTTAEFRLHRPVRKNTVLVPEGEWSGCPTRLVRYSIRCDGFRSAHAGESEKILVTKPFVFSGSDLFVNFETSALGYMYFTIVDKDGTRYESEETFGNSIDRKVYFGDDVVKNLSGKLVTLEVRMCDSDLYSIMFR